MAILRIKDDNGNVFDIPTIRGQDGITPVKGKDYYTKDEKVEMCNEVFAMLPTFEMVATFADGTTTTYRLYGEAVTA